MVLCVSQDMVLCISQDTVNSNVRSNYGGGSGSGLTLNMALVKVSKNVICIMTGSPSHPDCANSMFAHTYMLYMSSAYAT